MGILYDFMNNKAYGAADINNIRSAIISKGVVPEELASCGVVASATSGKVRISPGTAFFDDGARITIESPGEELSYSSSATNYVYLLNNKTANKCEALCSSTYPSGDYVMLATVSSAGAITDKRTYAKMKVPNFDSDWGKTRIIRVQMQGDGTIKPAEKDIAIGGGGGYHYFTFYSNPATYVTRPFVGWYENIANTYLCVSKFDGTFITNYILVPASDNNYELTASMVGSDDSTIRLSINHAYDQKFDFYMVASK